MPEPRGPKALSLPAVAVLALPVMALLGGTSVAQDEKARAPVAAAPQGATLEDTRLQLDKWIETQQILAKERKEWQQQKELLRNRIELLKKEISGLEEKIVQAEGEATAAGKKVADLQAEDGKVKAVGDRLEGDVAGLEGEVRRLLTSLPESLRGKMQLLVQRMPTKETTTRVSTPERFQNVLTILGEVNKANGEITVDNEVRTLPDGRRAEVQALYVGLGQAFYVNSGGLAGVGRPTAEGWQWEARPAIARQVLAAVEILQGKQTPAFVPLPVRIQ
jgi:hypothetical protein